MGVRPAHVLAASWAHEEGVALRVRRTMIITNAVTVVGAVVMVLTAVIGEFYWWIWAVYAAVIAAQVGANVRYFRNRHRLLPA